MFGKMLTCILASAVVISAADDRIESRDAHWKTIKTAHYYIHYPANPKAEFEPFAKEVASKIEGIHAKVSEWVGFEEKGPTNVLVLDSIMEANGATVPMLKRPVVVLYKTRPEQDSGIGHYNNWVDLLVTHELVHLHHLMRPQNDRTVSEKLLERLFLPVGPITLKAPRLILEGYATLLEGRITGSGRPHSAYRAAVLRQWALQGRLPDYNAVSATGGFRGGQMAYLVGSAYLEWLERQNEHEPDILKNFWKQLASKKRRSYDDSFKATFGTSPKDSYYRWKAEVTHDAIALERNAKEKGLIHEGQLIARFDAEISDLALSHDGSKLMARLISDKKPGIRIWDLNADPDSKKKKDADKEKEKDDPNEVEDRKPEFVEPKILTVIGKRNGVLPRHAWWTGENQVTFEMRIRNSEGTLKPIYKIMDIKTKKINSANKPTILENNEFTWKDIDGTWNIVRNLPDGREQQLTRTLSAAWQPISTPDGKSLYYVQLTATGCEIRKLDLTQPEIEDAPILISENLLVKDTVISPSDNPSLLPPATAVQLQASDYSVFDSHSTGFRDGYSFSPSTSSWLIGWGGADIRGRFEWYAAGAFGEARGSRGGGFGIAYRGWRFAPSLVAFHSLEKPSRYRFEPVQGFDRERQGAELAFSWQNYGMSPFMVKPFVAWESVKTDVPGIKDQLKNNRLMVGTTAGFDVKRSVNEWGIGVNATFQGAFGSTKMGTFEPIDSLDSHDNDLNWNIARLRAGLNFITPIGNLKISAEEGRLGGDYSILDAFHFGGQNASQVPDNLDMNRIQQPALPGYIQIGDRMRKLRAEYGSVLYAYVEKAAVWASDDFQNTHDYQRVAGIEIRSDDILTNNLLNFLSITPSVNFGVHRPFDGAMKGRTVFTGSVRMTF